MSSQPASIDPALSSSAAAPRRIAVIGGGISGLAAAHRLRELAPQAHVTLLEASGRLGGVLGTERGDGWLVEQSADMFTTREPWALDLCRRIDLADDLIGTDDRYRQAYVVRRGRLLPVPEGFTLMSPAKVWPVITTGILSPAGKLRLAYERFVPPRRDDADESLQSFVVRRMGREVFDRLVQPLIGGIYTADPAKLSMRATMPQFLDMERRHGSITRALRAQAKGAAKEGNRRESGARYGMFLAPRGGMGTLVEAIAARLPADCVRLNSAVERIEPTEEGWRIFIRGEAAPLVADDLVVAAPAPVAGRLLEPVDAALAADVASIPHAGCSVGVLGYRRSQIARALNFFGVVAPAIERRKALAISLASVKFAGRAPDDCVLVRAFVGGALQPELTDLPDDELERIVRAELADLLGARGEPEFCQIKRWNGAMPQYHVGHLDLVARIEARAAAIPRFALAGNAYRGVGIPFCIHSGEQAAEQIVSASAAAGREASRLP